MESDVIDTKLVVHCKDMKTPKLQRLKFDQTIEAGFWQLVEHKDATKHSNESVSTTTEWSREFPAGKNQKQIIKKTRNLISRASEYANILEVDFEIAIGDNPVESFSHHAEKSSDYFKTKTYR